MNLCLVGPTAAGKSALAHAVARAAGDVEIVSLDSMQVYRGLDIGTAKPTVAERAEIRYHLVDVVDPSQTWSVAETQRGAHAAISDIAARGRRALLVGGTGLYVQAVVDGFELPGEDLVVRAQLEAETTTPAAVRAAHSELARLDPDAAARIEPDNRRRVVRALEVVRSTGRPFSSFGPGVFSGARDRAGTIVVGVWRSREDLAARITARVDAMFAAGLVDEVERVTKVPLARTAAQAIGYKEVIAALGEYRPPDVARELVIRRTRSFARRQRMWFRRDPRTRWMGTAGDSERLAAAVLAIWAQPPTN